MAFPREWPWEVKTLLHRSSWEPRGAQAHEARAERSLPAPGGPREANSRVGAECPRVCPLCPAGKRPQGAPPGAGAGDVPPEPGRAHQGPQIPLRCWGCLWEFRGLGCSKACPGGFSTKTGNHQERELAREELGILGAWLGSRAHRNLVRARRHSPEFLPCSCCGFWVQALLWGFIPFLFIICGVFLSFSHQIPAGTDTQRVPFWKADAGKLVWSTVAPAACPGNAQCPSVPPPCSLHPNPTAQILSPCLSNH